MAARIIICKILMIINWKNEERFTSKMEQHIKDNGWGI